MSDGRWRDLLLLFWLQAYKEQSVFRLSHQFACLTSLDFFTTTKEPSQYCCGRNGGGFGDVIAVTMTKCLTLLLTDFTYTNVNTAGTTASLQKNQSNSGGDKMEAAE